MNIWRMCQERPKLHTRNCVTRPWNRVGIFLHVPPAWDDFPSSQVTWPSQPNESGGETLRDESVSHDQEHSGPAASVPKTAEGVRRQALFSRRICSEQQKFNRLGPMGEKSLSALSKWMNNLKVFNVFEWPKKVPFGSSLCR